MHYLHAQVSLQLVMFINGMGFRARPSPSLGTNWLFPYLALIQLYYQKCQGLGPSRATIVIDLHNTLKGSINQTAWARFTTSDSCANKLTAHCITCYRPCLLTLQSMLLSQFSESLKCCIGADTQRKEKECNILCCVPVAQLNPSGTC